MTKIKITNLKRDSYFIYQGQVFQKVDNYNITNDCLNTETGQIEHLPLMSLVEEASKPQKKKKRKTKKDNENDITQDDSAGLRDGWVGPEDMQSDSTSCGVGGSETTGDSP